MHHQSNCGPDLSSLATAPILRSAPRGGESELTFFAFFTLRFRKHTIIRGWVNYFRIGHSSDCFTFVKDWIERKVRRRLMRTRKRKGFGWKRWSKEWLYAELGLYNDYQVRYHQPKAAPVR
jgi:hypothetical protein